MLQQLHDDVKVGPLVDLGLEAQASHGHQGLGGVGGYGGAQGVLPHRQRYLQAIRKSGLRGLMISHPGMMAGVGGVGMSGIAVLLGGVKSSICSRGSTVGQPQGLQTADHSMAMLIPRAGW